MSSEKGTGTMRSGNYRDRRLSRRMPSERPAQRYRWPCCNADATRRQFDEPACVSNTTKNRFFVQRASGPGIDNLHMDAFLGQFFSSLLRQVDQRAIDDSNVVSFSDNVGFAERDRVAFFRPA